MKCYFDEKKKCPIPEKKVTGDFCLACTTIENMELTRRSVKATEKATKILENQTTYKEEKILTDEKKDVA